MSDGAAGSAASDAVRVALHRGEADEGWAAFLAASDNGTLFHDLRFLAYHPAARHEVHHLAVEREGTLVAVLPATLAGDDRGGRVLRSPYGASVGGPVWACGMGFPAAARVVRALQAHATGAGLAGIELVIGPSIYAVSGGDTSGYALAACGFQLRRRSLSPCLPLAAGVDVVGAIPLARRRSYVRAALRRGLEVTEADAGRLEAFYAVLESNRARHDARPTHTFDELARLFALVPGRVRLFVCEVDGRLAAGTVTLELNERVAYSFYPCHDATFDEMRLDALTMIRVAEAYAARGFRWLELGPSAWTDVPPGAQHLNPGVLRFKEEMGAVGFCRDAWTWSARA